MAKSIRSKRKRAIRAIKRKKVAVKELARLKQTVANLNAPEIRTLGGQLSYCIPFETPVGLSITEQQASDFVANTNGATVVPMDTSKNVRRHPVTLRDENGQYPIWMNHRKVKKHKAELKRKGIGKRKQKVHSKNAAKVSKW